MPNNPRHEIKRKLDYMIGNVEALRSGLIILGEVYREHHPEITKQYETVFAFFAQGEELLKGLRDTY